MIFLKLVKKLDARQKMTHICARLFIWLDARTCLSINICLFFIGYGSNRISYHLVSFSR